MKFKVGDKVKVKDNLIIGEFYGDLDWLGGMESLKGKILTIDVITGHHYYVVESGYYLSEEMLESVSEEKADDTATTDNVNHPSHYQGKHECIDEMIAMFGVEAVIGFCKCNVYKYRYRAASKNGQEDLDKANWYMDKLIELESEE